MAVYVIYPHDHWPSRPCQPRKPLQPVPLQLRRSHILQPRTSVPGALPHRDHAPIGRNLTVTKREKATLASHLAFIYAGDDRSLPLSEAEGLHILSRAVQSARGGLMRQGITRCEVNSGRPWNTLKTARSTEEFLVCTELLPAIRKRY